MCPASLPSPSFLRKVFQRNVLALDFPRNSFAIVAEAEKPGWLAGLFDYLVKNSRRVKERGVKMWPDEQHAESISEWFPPILVRSADS